MALIIHIAVALASLVLASWLLLQPSRAKAYANYGLIAATIASGTYLVVATGASLLHVCASGLCYLAVAAGLTVLAERRLARQAGS